jgi:hypothetical protein
VVETEDAFRAAVQIHGEDGWPVLLSPSGAMRELRPGDGLLTRKSGMTELPARCVRLATRNAYLTLESQLAGPSGNEDGTPAATGANDG